MTTADLTRSGTSQLEEFIALNDELSALVRAGLPLELGSGQGRQRVAADMTRRLREGQSLDDALQAQGASVPAAYRALVEAGLRSGRLADAVETISRSARLMLALRRRLSIAAIYPSIVIILSFLILLVLSPKLLETIVGIITDSHQTPPAVFTGLLWLLRDNPTGWIYWLPAVILLFLWAAGGVTALTLRLPGLNVALHSYRIAAFAELTAGLLDQGTPLDEALPLAAEASGDASLTRDAHRVAGELRNGRPIGEAFAGFRSVPRFAAWMMAAGATQGTLSTTFRQVADWASRRGAARADWFNLLAPVVLTLLGGGTAVVVVGVLTFGPVLDLLYRLTREFSL